MVKVIEGAKKRKKAKGKNDIEKLISSSRPKEKDNYYSLEVFNKSPLEVIKG